MFDGWEGDQNGVPFKLSVRPDRLQGMGNRGGFGSFRGAFGRGGVPGRGGFAGRGAFSNAAGYDAATSP